MITQAQITTKQKTFFLSNSFSALMTSAACQGWKGVSAHWDSLLRDLISARDVEVLDESPCVMEILNMKGSQCQSSETPNSC